MIGSRTIVITGMGAICALGDEPRAIHQALCEGKSGFGAPTVFPPEVAAGRQVAEIAGFRPQQYLGEKNVRPLDRTGRLAAVAAGLALADSGRAPGAPADAPVGLVVGTMFSSVRTIGEFDRRAQSAGPEYASPLDFSNTVLNAAAGQVAIWHRLSGVNSTIGGGPAAGLQAIGYAAGLIRDGRASVLVAGGVEELCFESFQGYLGARFLAEPGIKSAPFDEMRSGTALGEGAAFLVLEAEDLALARGARIVGRVLGFASGFEPAQSESGEDELARSVTRALAGAGKAASGVAAVLSSASGSPSQDLREARGIHAALGPTVPVTATKSMVGETLGASGALNAIVALESLRTRQLPGVAGLMARDTGVELNVSAAATTISGSCILVTAVAPEGNCCALVLGLA